MLAGSGLDALDGVEVPVLAQEARAERGDEPIRVAACAEVGGGELPGLVDVLLAVEQRRQLGQQRLRVGVRLEARAGASRGR